MPQNSKPIHQRVDLLKLVGLGKDAEPIVCIPDLVKVNFRGCEIPLSSLDFYFPSDDDDQKHGE